MQQIEMKLHKLSDQISKLENRIRVIEESLEEESVSSIDDLIKQARLEEIFKLGELTP
jgi:CII-binding regulator of phage lambda lysogenization HflD